LFKSTSLICKNSEWVKKKLKVNCWRVLKSVKINLHLANEIVRHNKIMQF
jgi:hypothetical protein